MGKQTDVSLPGGGRRRSPGVALHRPHREMVARHQAAAPLRAGPDRRGGRGAGCRRSTFAPPGRLQLRSAPGQGRRRMPAWRAAPRSKVKVSLHPASRPLWAIRASAKSAFEAL